MELTLNYGHYNSILSQGQRVRRMRRTELSCDKLFYLNSPKASRPPSRSSMIRSPQRGKRTTSMPKLQSLYLARAAAAASASPNQMNLVMNEYYKADPRPQTGGTQHKSTIPSPHVSVQEVSNNSLISNNSKQSSKSHHKSGKSFLNPKSQLSNKHKSSHLSALRPSSRSNSKTSQMFDRSSISKQSFNSSKKEQSDIIKATLKKSKINQNVDYYQIRKNISVNQSESKSNLILQESQNSVDISDGKIQKLPLKSQSSGFMRKKNQKISNVSNSVVSGHRLGESQYLENESKMSKKKSMKQSGIQQNLSSSQYMLKSNMLNSQIQASEYFSKSKKSKNGSKLNAFKMADPILQSSALIQENWKQTIKSINIQNKQSPSVVIKNSNIHQKSSSSSSVFKRKSHLNKEKKVDKNISLKLDSVKNQQFFKIPNQSVQNSLAAQKEQEQEPPCRDCIEDVIERVNLYDTLLEQIKDFQQTMKSFDSTFEDQTTQIICFLLNKKYMFEKSNLLKCLKGTGKNVFILPSVEIPNQILDKYIHHKLIVSFANDLQKNNVQFYKQFAEETKRIKTLVKGNKLIDNLTPNDDFTNDLVEMLWEQIDELYGQISALTEDQMSDMEDLIIQMMELIFLFSNMRGRRVKRIEFADFIEDFQEYLDKNMPKLEETLLFFKGQGE